jgi:hypothetical protein
LDVSPNRLTRRQGVEALLELTRIEAKQNPIDGLDAVPALGRHPHLHRAVHRLPLS